MWKEYGFLSFAKIIGKILSNKFVQKLFHIAKTSPTDAIKTNPKILIEKTAEATADLIGNKSADKITIISKKFSSKHSDGEIQVDRASSKNVPKKRYTSPEERQRIID